MTGVRRKVRDAVDARSCLNEAERAGLTRAAWARANGVDGRSLNMWRVILARNDADRVVPLRLVEVVSRSAAPVATYTVRVDRFAVDVDEAFNDEVLRRLLGVLSSC